MSAVDTQPTLQPRGTQQLNAALHRLFSEHPEVYLLGEDILDPYGGAFKVSAGLSSRWPERVLATPISEGAIVGVAGGMALRGLRPIVEIMFGDFVTLAADAIVNYATKFRGMYNDQVRCPIVIRTPMGGRRGYGPTHSQTLESLFLGVHGLRIVAPSRLHDAGALLEYEVLHTDDPTLFVENKLLYGERATPPADGRLDIFSCRTAGEGAHPLHFLSPTDFEDSEITILAYGGMVGPLIRAAEGLIINHEISAELVIPSLIRPINLDGLAESLGRTGRLLIVEEGPLVGGWGAEMVAQAQQWWPLLRAPIGRVASRDSIIPSAPSLEAQVLPDVDDIVEAVLRMVPQRR